MAVTWKALAYAEDGITRLDQSVADDDSIELTNASIGICYVTCNGEHTMFAFFADGTIHEIGVGTDNIAYADTDANLCVFASGTQVSLKNRLGGTYTMKAMVVYL